MAFVEGSGHPVFARIFDGLIYLSRVGVPVDPIEIKLDPFGVIRVEAEPIGDGHTGAAISLQIPPYLEFWRHLSVGSDTEKIPAVLFAAESCCLPITLAYLFPLRFEHIACVAMGRVCPFRLRDFPASPLTLRYPSFPR